MTDFASMNEEQYRQWLDENYLGRGVTGDPRTRLERIRKVVHARLVSGLKDDRSPVVLERGDADLLFRILAAALRCRPHLELYDDFAVTLPSLQTPWESMRRRADDAKKRDEAIRGLRTLLDRLEESL